MSTNLAVAKQTAQKYFQTKTRKKKKQETFHQNAQKPLVS
jgi:hypothetical protein